jgi:hypothetical protein
VLRDSGLNFTVANGMKDAAEKVVALANQQQAVAEELQNRSMRNPNLLEKLSYRSGTSTAPPRYAAENKPRYSRPL